MAGISRRLSYQDLNVYTFLTQEEMCQKCVDISVIKSYEKLLDRIALLLLRLLCLCNHIMYIKLAQRLHMPEQVIQFIPSVLYTFYNCTSITGTPLIKNSLREVFNKVVNS